MEGNYRRQTGHDLSDECGVHGSADLARPAPCEHVLPASLLVLVGGDLSICLAVCRVNLRSAACVKFTAPRKFHWTAIMDRRGALSGNAVFPPQSSEMPSGYCSASAMPNYRDNSARAAPISSASETGSSRIARWTCMPTGLAADATMIIGRVGRSSKASTAS